MSGFQVDPEVLGRVERGITEALENLGALAPHGSERSAIGLERLRFEFWEAGHQGLLDTHNNMVERMHWCLRDLLTESEDHVERLVDTRTAYEKAQDAATAAFQKILDTVQGDPLGGS
ncbi:hypothetical protein GCM10012275_57600 [Longimycelium tulufanense]|uniref:Uncharacterized protein n=1 Tax=Longimycelium tulufanense TaxID=907463 RepID=A0A8J3CHU0_9PSEU|nr:hypothetical protein [Longimycelium tulufanense]GGM79464.1 hypothetical protein GCM10012275_57600 [Longimycelium tulufanense]